MVKSNKLLWMLLQCTRTIFAIESDDEKMFEAGADFDILNGQSIPNPHRWEWNLDNIGFYTTNVGASSNYESDPNLSAVPENFHVTISSDGSLGYDPYPVESRGHSNQHQHNPLSSGFTSPGALNNHYQYLAGGSSNQQVTKRPLKIDFTFWWILYQPTTSAGRLVLDALTSLNSRPSHKLLEHPELKALIPSLHQHQHADSQDANFICLNPAATDIGKFIQFYRQEEGAKTQHQNTSQVDRFAKAWWKIRDRRSITFPLRNYLNFILEKINGHDRDLIRLRVKLQSDILVDDLENSTASTIIKMYLIYVNMISAIIPVGVLDNEGKLLERQRQGAVRSFNELLFEEIGENTTARQKKIINEVKEQLDKFKGSPKKKAYFGYPIIWSALEYWLQSYGVDHGIDLSTQLVSSAGQDFVTFKRFFNNLIFTQVIDQPNY